LTVAAAIKLRFAFSVKSDEGGKCAITSSLTPIRVHFRRCPPSSPPPLPSFVRSAIIKLRHGSSREREPNVGAITSRRSVRGCESTAGRPANYWNTGESEKLDNQFAFNNPRSLRRMYSTGATGPEIGMRIRCFVVATPTSVASICPGPGFRFAYEWFMPS